MNTLERLKVEAREKLAPNVTYIDPKFKEVASWAEELLNAFWVEQQKDLDAVIEHTHTQTIHSVRERVEGMKVSLIKHADGCPRTFNPRKYCGCGASLKEEINTVLDDILALLTDEV